MDCERIRDLMVLVLFDEAEPEQRVLVGGHVERCEACRDYYAELRAAAALLERMPRFEPPRRRRRRLRPRLARATRAAAAAAVVLMSRRKAAELDLEPFAAIRCYSSGGVDPAYMGLGPVPAVRRALRRAGLSLEDMDLVEINEAFAAQAIACMRELGLSKEEVNPHGSGISLGHPIGASGARMVVSAMYDMRRRGLRRAILAMCIGGGQGMAMVLERD